ncbi:methionine gamma-lyase [Paenisporosarcina cavernae]|uniref:L-methionine gamma-lyase n=1 Tax=Paenisporosarcina cavernae TaxID=2320858 RepID=A0A385YZL4_9BACL|nr:methionine gamma-lyase [Paenisporosarcina cavernae]AYC30802.1 methionine gamma-lyase [Paenisporosarcina cavernae]
MSNQNWMKETKLIHTGYQHSEHKDALTVPLYQTSTFAFPSAEAGEKRFSGEEDGMIYSRLGNPTVRVLEEKMAELENGAACLAFGSGMAAVSTVLLHTTKANDHVLCSRGIYGCTFGLLELLEEKYSITHTFHPLDTADSIEAAIQPNTTVIYVETPINPTMELVDLELVATVAKKHGIRLIVDNTFSSPLGQSPLQIGADFVLHSATKYINGHGDVIAGLLIGTDEEEMLKIRMTVQKDVGGIISPFDAWLILRGLKTLSVRMERHVKNAEKIAAFLENESFVEHVFYPYSDKHPQVELAKKQMAFGSGLVSFTIKGGKEAAQYLMNQLELVQIAVSLGDAETLIQHPATMTHSVIPENQREEMGITHSLLRLSAGLEIAEDIVEDLRNALQATEKKFTFHS